MWKYYLLRSAGRSKGFQSAFAWFMVVFGAVLLVLAIKYHDLMYIAGFILSGVWVELKHAYRKNNK